MSYLDRRGEDLQSLYEHSDWPAEFLRDPSYWLEAPKMESLLRFFKKEFAHTVSDGSFIREVGHQCKDLRSWGVLDSVLRMVQSPKDLFAQPERFLSYFISPAPPIGNLRRDFDSVRFEIPISSSEYPLVVEYLSAAFEALPTYMGKPMAHVEWLDSKILVRWSDQQVSFFDEGKDTEHSLHPELLQNILINLENSQKQLEETKRLLLAKDVEVQDLRKQLSQRSQSVAAIIKSPARESRQGQMLGIPLKRDLAAEYLGDWAEEHFADFSTRESFGQVLGEVTNDIYRLNDYMARAQQLVTILIGQSRGSPQVQEAMRRMDWAFVQTEAPVLARTAAQKLKETQKLIKTMPINSSVDQKQSPSDSLNSILNSGPEQTL